MKQALFNQLKGVVIDNRHLSDEQINTNVSAALDVLVSENKILNYTLSVEQERIILSIVEKPNTVSCAFQVARD